MVGHCTKVDNLTSTMWLSHCLLFQNSFNKKLQKKLNSDKGQI